MGDKRIVTGNDGKNYIRYPYPGDYRDDEKWDDGAGDIKHIIITYDRNMIYSIQTFYQGDGEIVMSSLHGVTQGNVEMISLSEPLTWISGHYGSYCLDPDLFGDEEEMPYNYGKAIFSLTLGTAGSTYGPFSRRPHNGEPFSFRSTTRIGGFHGCVEGQLSAIGVYIQIPT